MLGNQLTYVSLFSGAGVGCHGLGMAGFRCLATVEILPRRLEIQKFNGKCRDDESYICGDLADSRVMSALLAAAQNGGDSLDVVMATPPCQGMSVFNHKKGDESGRNSLIVSAIRVVGKLRPKVFIFENVAQFFNTPCDLPRGRRAAIGDAINEILGSDYNIHQQVVNLKNYGCPSSRTRALAIGVDKKLSFSPLPIFPDWREEKTLRDVIGDLPSLRRNGQIDPGDIYHSFKPYASRMRAWISGLREGQSAFERKSPNRRPHKIVRGKIVENKNGNGDKYRRQRWDAVAPCVHTRNDILASQNTVHPRDDRVFSIREVMRMMGIPDNFRWLGKSSAKLSLLDANEQRAILRKSEYNIRQCLGEAVPPSVIFEIASKIKHFLADAPTVRSRKGIGQSFNLSRALRCKTGWSDVGDLMRLVENENVNKAEHAAYYTPLVTAFKVLKMLPAMPKSRSIRVLEPSVGAGQILRFLPFLLSGYDRVEIDAMDIDENILGAARQLVAHYSLPRNVKINFIRGDFLSHSFGEKRYDIIVGNPPFRKMLSAEARHYQSVMQKKIASPNIFAFFLTKSLDLAHHVALVAPKSFLNAPEYNETRRRINSCHTVRQICDFGEKGFDGIKIETIALAIEAERQQILRDRVLVESVFFNTHSRPRAADIFCKNLPYWVIYRDKKFDAVLSGMSPGVFSAFRDRQITKKHTRLSGGARVMKSRNVLSNGVLDTDKDVYVDLRENFAVQKFINRDDVFLVPNLSYAPRACRLPQNSVADGSVAILYPREKGMPVRNSDLEFFASDDFRAFYRVARNHGTRTLNIDANSVFFFGVRT